MTTKRILSGMVLAALVMAAGAGYGAPRMGGQSGESNPAAMAAAKLDKKQFQQVQVTVDNGIAMLTGTVPLAIDKADAQKRVARVKGVTAVRNMIAVAGPSVPDAELEKKLGEKLAYDRVGYGNTFNAIALKVTDGVVTLGGHARTYVDRDSAIALVSTYPGVKDVVDEVEVDPVSTMDDQLRLAVARAVYGDAQLSRYSIDPAKPIRISVQNGNVEMYGTVDSKGDKEVAYLRAMGVPGSFSVKNYLQVAGASGEGN
jgi:osmotically-inducible protein OsmY